MAYDNACRLTNTRQSDWHICHANCRTAAGISSRCSHIAGINTQDNVFESLCDCAVDRPDTTASFATLIVQLEQARTYYDLPSQDREPWWQATYAME